jgi:hypothetical protein
MPWQRGQTKSGSVFFNCRPTSTYGLIWRVPNTAPTLPVISFVRRERSMIRS